MPLILENLPAHEAVAEIESLKNTRNQLETDLFIATHGRAYPGDAD